MPCDIGGFSKNVVVNVPQIIEDILVMDVEVDRVDLDEIGLTG